MTILSVGKFVRPNGGPAIIATAGSHDQIVTLECAGTPPGNVRDRPAVLKDLAREPNVIAARIPGATMPRLTDHATRPPQRLGVIR